MLIQYTVCEYLKYMIIYTIHVSDNIIVNHNQVMFNMICIIRHTYWVSTNTIKCNIHVLIRVPRMCIPVIGSMHTLHIPPLYNTISNYHNFKSHIKTVGFFYDILMNYFCNHQFTIILTILWSLPFYSLHWQVKNL